MVPDQMAYDQHGQPLIVSNKHGTFAQWPPLGYNVIVILPMKLGEFLGESLARMKSVLYRMGYRPGAADPPLRGGKARIVLEGHPRI